MESLIIPEISYGEFGRGLIHPVIQNRIPIMGSLEVSRRCNLKCVHCYVNLSVNDDFARKHELSADEFREIIDQFCNEGCLWLLFTGGEPFIRPDFLDIYTYAIKKGLLLTIFTNATAITPEIADYLAEWRPLSIEVSVYGYSKHTHESVTRAPGSYEKCLEGINLLLERNLPVKLKTMVMTLNRHELRDMEAYAERLGVQFRFDPILSPRIDGGGEPLAYRLPVQDVVDLDLQSDKRHDAWCELLKKETPPQDSNDLYVCGAGLMSFHIDPYGKLSLCMMARNPAYDLTKGSFDEGWREVLFNARKKKRTSASPCRKCELYSTCGQCPGWAQIENGDPESPIKYLCDIARLRAYQLENYKGET